jgi:hypothetical protein
MRSLARIVAALLALVVLNGGIVWAQGGYTISTPGQPTTFVDRNPLGGGYTVWTPGQPRSFIDPNPVGGGYTITTPGQPTTFINRNGPRPPSYAN